VQILCNGQDCYARLRILQFSLTGFPIKLIAFLDHGLSFHESLLSFVYNLDVIGRIEAVVHVRYRLLNALSAQ
jgi:hypothetical protein